MLNKQKLISPILWVKASPTIALPPLPPPLPLPPPPSPGPSPSFFMLQATELKNTNAPWLTIPSYLTPTSTYTTQYGTSFERSIRRTPAVSSPGWPGQSERFFASLSGCSHFPPKQPLPPLLCPRPCLRLLPLVFDARTLDST